MTTPLGRRSLLAAVLGLVTGAPVASGASAATTTVVGGPVLYTCELVAVFAAEVPAGDYPAEWPPCLDELRQQWEGP